MKDLVAAVCDTVISESGPAFLLFMRDAHEKNRLRMMLQNDERRIAKRCLELGLLLPRGRGRGYSLTTLGNLVHSIAIEYCSWIDKGRVMSPPRPPCEWVAGKDVLDLGCSIGRWLWEFQTDARSATGLELRDEYIRIGKALAMRESIPPPRTVHGSIEEIDVFFPPQSADLVFCRLMLNHVAMEKTLRKVIPVLRDGGVLWIQVESFRYGLRQIFKGRGPKAKLFGVFGVLNSLVCELTGAQLNFRYRGRHQSSHRAAYPSKRWYIAALARLGLTGNVVDSGEHSFCIWARKKPPAATTPEGQRRRRHRP